MEEAGLAMTDQIAGYDSTDQLFARSYRFSSHAILSLFSNAAFASSLKHPACALGTMQRRKFSD